MHPSHVSANPHAHGWRSTPVLRVEHRVVPPRFYHSQKAKLTFVSVPPDKKHLFNPSEVVPVRKFLSHVWEHITYASVSCAPTLNGVQVPFFSTSMCQRCVVFPDVFCKK
ncbi:hypothetical protein POVWA2_039350 [Plasmodium ovale wallikeri]|uniref:Uncharacterized protein n=1 Tax=Plasmodium ovale wallikeri TaxID=864142 RepID=A0A1A8Z8V8_PLAOA|nr:hypothetical protein POVWA1_040590 [Plasmodium ovale wallikeri]SBT40263.1 hypothetical protein POVWA2_039350 [Plasmodium ovale wallikeri]